ncbi:ABC transporter permease [Oryzibacter oryziterrae]|uniref:ABC transporter permease n=1 Tax=Oryzibacter oryziterrae TaxID=2766474 RepID=UPI001F00AD6C|nr:ABC transporter permease [Oryzibacter oryziterrae]
MGAASVSGEHAGIGERADADGHAISLTGDWTLDTVGSAADMLAKAYLPQGGVLVIDGASIGRLDTAGAWVVEKARRQFVASGVTVRFEGFPPSARTLLAAVEPLAEKPLPVPAKELPLKWLLSRVGQETAELVVDAVAILAMLGEVIVSFAGMLTFRRRMRWPALFSHVGRTSMQAVPIIGLMSFLIGMIISQQGGFYLHTYGADVLVVDLVGVLTCREIGVLLTAIMVAGRSGSAFTAEIGSMKMREEIDAMSVLGLSPVDVLVLPRLTALAIALPILTLVADLSAMAGAWVVALFYIGIPTDVFIERLHVSLTVTQVMIGFTKAPFMAAIIGLVACSEGMKVKGSAESLGEHTTASVVKAIFMVVVTDGVFAIAFATLGI